MAKKVTTVFLLISAPCVFAYTATEGAKALSAAPTKAKAVAVSVYKQKELLEHELRKLEHDHATGSKDLAADLAATQARLAAVTEKCAQCKTAEDELGVAYTASIAAHQTTENILAQLNTQVGLNSAVTTAEGLVDKSPLVSAIESYKTLVDAFSAASATQLVGPPDFAGMVTTINGQWDAVKAARDAKVNAEQTSIATSPCTDAVTGDKVVCTDGHRTAAATAETTADNAVTLKKAAQVTACAGMPEGTPSPASSTSAYTRVNSGQPCVDTGLSIITSVSDCSTAASTLGLSDQSAVTQGTNRQTHPKGCWLHTSGGNSALFWNPSTTSTSSCQDDQACVCSNESSSSA